MIEEQAFYSLGKKVAHTEYGHGQVVELDFGHIGVLFNSGALVDFYGGDRGAEKDWVISELSFAE